MFQLCLDKSVSILDSLWSAVFGKIQDYISVAPSIFTRVCSVWLFLFSKPKLHLNDEIWGHGGH